MKIIKHTKEFIRSKIKSLGEEKEMLEDLKKACHEKSFKFAQVNLWIATTELKTEILKAMIGQSQKVEKSG